MVLAAIVSLRIIFEIIRVARKSPLIKRVVFTSSIIAFFHPLELDWFSPQRPTSALPDGDPNNDYPIDIAITKTIRSESPSPPSIVCPPTNQEPKAKTSQSQYLP